MDIDAKGISMPLSEFKLRYLAPSARSIFLKFGYLIPLSKYFYPDWLFACISALLLTGIISTLAVGKVSQRNFSCVHDPDGFGRLQTQKILCSE
jgi:hypothetical protein